MLMMPPPLTFKIASRKSSTEDSTIQMQGLWKIMYWTRYLEETHNQSALSEAHIIMVISNVWEVQVLTSYMMMMHLLLYLLNYHAERLHMRIQPFKCKVCTKSCVEQDKFQITIISCTFVNALLLYAFVKYLFTCGEAGRSMDR